MLCEYWELSTLRWTGYGTNSPFRYHLTIAEELQFVPCINLRNITASSVLHTDLMFCKVCSHGVFCFLLIHPPQPSVKTYVWYFIFFTLKAVPSLDGQINRLTRVAQPYTEFHSRHLTRKAKPQHLPGPQEKKMARDHCFSLRRSLAPLSASWRKLLFAFRAFHLISILMHIHPSSGPAGINPAHPTIKRLCQQSILIMSGCAGKVLGHSGLKHFFPDVRRQHLVLHSSAPQWELPSGAPPFWKELFKPFKQICHQWINCSSRTDLLQLRTSRWCNTERWTIEWKMFYVLQCKTQDADVRVRICC